MENTTTQEAAMKPQPFTHHAEVIHMDVLRRARERREQAAKAAEISVENRNLSQAWSLNGTVKWTSQ